MNDTCVKGALALLAILSGLVACCMFNSCVARAQKHMKPVASISHELNEGPVLPKSNSRRLIEDPSTK